MDSAMESRLIPVLREGVDIIKMVLFKQIKQHLERTLVDRQAADVTRISGAIINEVFGTPNPAPEIAAFVSANRALIEKELDALHVNFQGLMAPVTDAMRIQFLCDHQEGIGSQAVLVQAKALRILQTDRDIPLPNTFIDLARRLGVAHNLIRPPAPVA